jgi:hypothetical protein
MPFPMTRRAFLRALLRAAASSAAPRFTLEGWEYGSISRHCVQFG